MWVPKYVRDRKKGVDCPVPTQVVSNEELIPRPQHDLQKQVEARITEMGRARAGKVGMDRREFMAGSMGIATSILAMNQVYGDSFDVDEAETFEPAAYEEKWPKSEYFIFDVQTHFTNGLAIGFRNHEFMRNMGFKLDAGPEAYSFPNFVKELFFDSETSMVVISGVPGKEINKDEDGKILEGPGRTPGLRGKILPSWLMSKRKNDINNAAGSVRALCQGNCAPNHYWDRKNNKPNLPELYEQMEREVKVYGIDSWKWYCHADPGRSGGGFRLDDEELAYPFYEKSKQLGIRNFSVHKGYAYQSRTLGHLANPQDVEKAALDHPDLNFIIYHSAMKHGTTEPTFKDPERFAKYFDPETGDFAWHDVLMKIKQRNGQMTNVYPEIGSAFASLAVDHPVMAMHLIGKNVKYYGVEHVIWGTDCLWWGSPQWVIDLFKRFQISDEVCEKFGYKKLTKADKAKIFGLNAARLYNIDVDEKRRLLPEDSLEKFKQAYHEHGGLRGNAAYGWVRDDA